MFARRDDSLRLTPRKTYREPQHLLFADLRFAGRTSVCSDRKEPPELPRRGQSWQFVRRTGLVRYEHGSRKLLDALYRNLTMAKKLYVGNLGYDVNTPELEQLFAGHGSVDNVSLITDRSTGQGKGFGFVEMSSEADAQSAIAALDGKEFGGRTLKVNEARPRPATPPGGGRRDRR